MTDNFFDDPASTGRSSVDTYLQDNLQNLDFKSANEIATATVALTAPQGLEEAHDMIVQDLISNGSNSTVDQIRSAIEQGKKGELRQAIYEKLTSLDTPPEEKEDLRKLFVESQEQQIYTNVNLEKEMLRTYSEDAVARAKTEEERKIKAMWHEDINTTVDNQSLINSSIEDFKSDIAIKASESPLGSVTKLIKDAVISIAPLEQGIFYSNLLKTFLPEESNRLADTIFQGEALKKLQDHFLKLPPEQRTMEAKRLLDTIAQTGSYLGDNAINKFYAANDILDMVAGNKDPNSVNWMRWIQNVGGVVDLVGLGAIVKKVPYLFSRITGQLPKIEVVAPKVATPLVKEAIASEKIAQKLGKTSEEVAAEHAYPALEMKGHKVQQVDTIRTMNVTDRAVLKEFQLSENAQETAEKLLDIQNSTYAYTTPTLRQAATEKLIDEVNDIKDMYLNTNYSALGDAPFKQGADGVSFKGVFGKEDHGFSSWAEAVGAAKKAMPGETSRILVASPETGGVLKYVEDVPTISKGEYFVEVQKFTYYDEASNVLNLGKVTHAGALTEYLMDYQSIFAKPWVDGFNRMIDKADVGAKELRKLWEPFRKAVEKDEKVFHTIHAGLLESQKAGRRLLSHELDAIGISTPKLQELYNAQMDTSIVAWIVNNSRERSRLLRAGMNKQIVDPSTGMIQYGRVLDEVPTGQIDVVYDTTTGAFKNVTASEVQKLYADGHRLAQLESPIKRISKVTGDEAALVGSNYVLLRKGGKVKAVDLPNKVMGYIPGYFPRKYTDPYFIVEVIENAKINGKEVIADGIKGYSHAITSAPTKLKAEQAVAKLNEGATKGVRYELRLDKKLSREQIDKFHKHLDVNRGTVIKSRGKGLTDVENILGSEHGIDTMAEIQHPMKAMDNYITATTKSASHERTMIAAQKAFTNQYAEFLQASEGKFPMSEGMIIGPPSSKLREARAAYRQLSMLQGLEDNVGKVGREGMLRLSEWLGDKGFGKTAEFVAGHRDISPLRTLRSVNFFRMIASDPIKQWILQPSQILFTAGVAPKYAFTKLVPDMSVAFSGLLAKNMPASSPFKGVLPDMKTLAQMFGTSEKEFSGMLQAIEDSGVLITDSHAFIKNMSYKNMSDLYNSSLEKNVMSIANNFKHANKVFVDVGFNPAEKMNMLGQWLIARNRVLEKSPNLVAGTKAYSDAIGAEARGIALGMKQGFKYSDNAFAAMATQFMTFQHKAWLSIIGKNAYFSPADRVGLAATQFLLWGTTGLGLKAAADNVLARIGIQKDKQSPVMKEAIEVLEDGLLEKGINTTLQAAGIDDMKVAWSDRFSVFNAYQNNMVKTALALFSGETQIDANILFGPSKTTYAATKDMLGTMALVYKTHDIDNTTFWKMQAKNAVAWLPSLSRVLQFQVATNTGLLPNSTGTYFTETTTKEAAWYMLTGMQSKQREAYFEVMDLTSTGQMKAQKSDARVIYEQMSKYTTILDAEDLTPELYGIYDKKLKESMTILGTVISKADPFYRAGIERELGQLLENDPKRGKDSLMYKLSKFYSMVGQDGQSTLTQLTNIRNKADELKMDDTDKQAVDALINYYKESMDAFNIDFTKQENQ